MEKLRAWGHDVITARELGMQRASDEELLIEAQQTKRLLVTRDKDYGALVFLKKTYSVGVIFLRMNPSTAEDVHREFSRFLQEHNETQLQRCFSVIEQELHRIRKIGS
jgi:predicted nuclease of predicted toxin-antitoxin system